MAIEIEIQSGAVQVEASLLGKGLSLEPSLVPELLRKGAITCRFERGIDEDEGSYRLSFFHDGRRLRIVFDLSGHVLQWSAIDFGDRPLPASLHRPGQ